MTRDWPVQLGLGLIYIKLLFISTSLFFLNFLFLVKPPIPSSIKPPLISSLPLLTPSLLPLLHFISLLQSPLISSLLSTQMDDISLANQLPKHENHAEEDQSSKLFVNDPIDLLDHGDINKNRSRHHNQIIVTASDSFKNLHDRKTEQHQLLSEIEIRTGDDNQLLHDSIVIENRHLISPIERESKNDSRIPITQPNSQLPKPEAPPGLSPRNPNDDVPNQLEEESRSVLDDFSINMPSIGKFFRQSSNAFVRRLSSLKESRDDDKSVSSKPSNDSEVTEFKLSGLKVVVKLKSEDEIRGRVSFFSRSNCRDCTAVRNFFKQRGLKFVEINIDVYPLREKEMIERTGSKQVPQIFFNEKLFGGLVALNSLRNSGVLESKLKEMLMEKCSSDAPSPPAYGFDDCEEEESMDEMVGIVRVLRQKLPIQDRLMKMKLVKNCFSGSELVEVLINHLDCGRKKAIEIGRQVARKHFIHHVFGENDFEDGNHFYRFLEHEPFIPKCYNFQGSTNDCEPKPAVKVGQRLTKIMSAILESYASEDRHHVDYVGISRSEEFRRYVRLGHDLQRVNIVALSSDEKLAFFLNLHNAMVIHAIIRVGSPDGVLERRSFISDFQYIVGGYAYSLSTIKNGILRSNRRPAYGLTKPFGADDKRLEFSLLKMNPLIHFGVCDGTKSSPTVRFFTPQGVETELRTAAREFFQAGGIEIVLDKRVVRLTRIIKWFDADFGDDKELFKWILIYLDPTNAGLLTHLLGDGGQVGIVYRDYNYSPNT